MLTGLYYRDPITAWEGHGVWINGWTSIGSKKNPGFSSEPQWQLGHELCSGFHFDLGCICIRKCSRPQASQLPAGRSPSPTCLIFINHSSYPKYFADGNIHYLWPIPYPFLLFPAGRTPLWFRAAIVQPRWWAMIGLSQSGPFCSSLPSLPGSWGGGSGQGGGRGCHPILAMRLKPDTALGQKSGKLHFLAKMGQSRAQNAPPPSSCFRCDGWSCNSHIATVRRTPRKLQKVDANIVELLIQCRQLVSSSLLVLWGKINPPLFKPLESRSEIQYCTCSLWRSFWRTNQTQNGKQFVQNLRLLLRNSVPAEPLFASQPTLITSSRGLPLCPLCPFEVGKSRG